MESVTFLEQKHHSYFSVLLPGKLFYQSKIVGEKLVEDYVKKTRRNPPSVFGFDGKIMETNIYEEDDDGNRHPKTSKIDQIGKGSRGNVLEFYIFLEIPG